MKNNAISVNSIALIVLLIHNQAREFSKSRPPRPESCVGRESSFVANFLLIDSLVDSMMTIICIYKQNSIWFDAYIIRTSARDPHRWRSTASAHCNWIERISSKFSISSVGCGGDCYVSLMCQFRSHSCDAPALVTDDTTEYLNKCQLPSKFIRYRSNRCLRRRWMAVIWPMMIVKQLPMEKVRRHCFPVRLRTDPNHPLLTTSNDRRRHPLRRVFLLFTRRIEAVCPTSTRRNQRIGPNVISARRPGPKSASSSMNMSQSLGWNDRVRTVLILAYHWWDSMPTEVERTSVATAYLDPIEQPRRTSYRRRPSKKQERCRRDEVSSVWHALRQGTRSHKIPDGSSSCANLEWRESLWLQHQS